MKKVPDSCRGGDDRVAVTMVGHSVVMTHSQTGAPVIASSQTCVIGNRICDLHRRNDEPWPTQL